MILTGSCEKAEAVSTARSGTECGDASASTPRYSIGNKPVVSADYVARMRARGSSAKTLRGALRFAYVNREGCIPGLACLRPGVRVARVNSPSRQIDFDTRYNWSHAARVHARAQAVYALTASSDSLLGRLDACRSALPQATEDLRLAVEAIAKSSIEHQVSRSLRQDWPYRQSTSAWAGGEHRVTVTIGELPQAVGDSTRAWSANGKWSGTNSSAAITVTERCLRNLGLRPVVADLLTLDAERVGPREYRVVWVEQGRGFALKTVEGWLIRGYHVAGGTLAAARNKAATARHKRAMLLLYERVGKQLAGYDLSAVSVTRADSLAAGNCISGTDSFVERFREKLNGRTAIPAEELLRWRNDAHTRAAVSAAILRERASGEGEA